MLVTVTSGFFLQKETFTFIVRSRVKQFNQEPKMAAILAQPIG